VIFATGCGPSGDEGPFVRAVPDGFFGVNGQHLRPLPGAGKDEELENHLEEIEAAGIDFVRANVDWRQLEPLAPVRGEHRFDFASHDVWMQALAEHHLAWQLVGQGIPTPDWAASQTGLAAQCGSRSPPERAGDLASLMAGLARRYGRGGSFWQEHSRVPYEPVIEYEIWNEPNHGAFWCPTPDPEAYADLYLQAQRAIHAVDPKATVLTGGLAGFKQSESLGPEPLYLGVDEFLSRMVAQRPSLRDAVDAVAVHAYEPEAEQVVSDIGWYRGELEEAGLGDAPMSVNEVGWPTQGQSGSPVPEAERASKLRELADAIARTDCGVVSFAPHTWVTEELDPADYQDWYGISAPRTGDPYPSAVAYAEVVDLFEGRGSEPPPHETLTLCAGDD